MSASYVVLSTPHSRWIMSTLGEAGAGRGRRGGVRARVNPQIENGVCLPTCTDS